MNRTTAEQLLLAQRRAFLGRAASGMLGSIALSWLAARDSRAAEAHSGPHHRPRATRIICLFQNGGPSQMDLFDEKPKLAELSGKSYPGKQKVETLSPSASGNLLGSPYKFTPAGQCGMWLSEVIPHMAGIAEDSFLVRSMTTESVCH